MQSRVRYLLYNVVRQAWLNRMADNVTSKMFSALWFDTREDAEHWLYDGYYSPADNQDYIVQRTVTIIQEVEDEYIPKAH